MICKYLLVYYTYFYTYFFGNCWHTCCQQANEEQPEHASIVKIASEKAFGTAKPVCPRESCNEVEIITNGCAIY